MFHLSPTLCLSPFLSLSPSLIYYRDSDSSFPLVSRIFLLCSQPVWGDFIALPLDHKKSLHTSPVSPVRVPTRWEILKSQYSRETLLLKKMPAPPSFYRIKSDAPQCGIQGPLSWTPASFSSIISPIGSLSLNKVIIWGMLYILGSPMHNYNVGPFVQNHEHFKW